MKGVFSLEDYRSLWGINVRITLCVLLYREKEYLDEREAMQREHIASEQKYRHAVRELQAKVL